MPCLKLGKPEEEKKGKKEYRGISSLAYY